MTVRRTFGLSEDEQLIEKNPAWLLKSIMLQGHLFIMSNFLCFYAYFPRHRDTVVKSGYLVKRSRTSSRQHRHWFILKNHVLSYYNHSAEIYQASGNIDLRRASDVLADVENSVEGHYAFKVINADRTYYLRADTASATNEWIKVLKKVIFRINNQGDSVKIKIPFSSIIEVEQSEILEFAKTMKVKVADDDDTFTINEYYFSLFVAADTIFERVRSMVSQANSRPSSADAKLDGVDKVIEDTSRKALAYRRPKIFEKLAEVDPSQNIEHFAQDLVQDESSMTDSMQKLNPFKSHDHDKTGAETLMSTSPERTSLTKSIGHRLKGVANVATAVPRQLFGGKSDDDPAAIDLATANAFRAEFALLEEEKLLKTCQAYRQSTVPIPGTFYIGDRHICFRSSAPAPKDRVLLPMNDVEIAQEQSGFRLGLSGLALKIRAHETMFFEFLHSADRDQSIHFINGCLENIKSVKERDDVKQDSASQQADKDSREHEELEEKLRNAGRRSESRRPPLENVLDAPPIVFDSPNASLVAFKPQKKMRFTCLTIGSRGDVQPYVALCKGLIADGQQAKIATHEEFRDFVEDHGIEFVPIDGNPEELMAICVEHGMFTYSFLKEASQKFRGWIDELLSSSWKACQNTDILIESPSAMGGIHIAEALGIPYYRAFTMPWSKTRVYPHAFAVPDSSKGGTYNTMTYSAFDILFWKAISGQVNRWRKKSLNLPATNFDKLAQHKVPFLYNFSPFVVPPAIDWPEWIRVTGYWFLDGSDDKGEDEKWEAPENVTKFIDQAHQDDKKLAYIGFGSIVVSDPKALTKAVVEAVNKSGVRCILVKGWSDRSSQKDKDKDESSDDKDEKADDEEADPHQYGENTLSIDSIPHDWLFPQMDVVCHHGGAGSLGASLRAGIPTIVKPFFGDQHFFGERVHDLGVGVCLKKLNVSKLTEAIETCCTDRLIISKAQKIGEQIRSERGVDNAIENIYRDLEYAKSLVKYPRRANASEHSDQSWEEVDGPSKDDDSEMTADDSELYDQSTDDSGKHVSVLKSLKDIRLPNPLGSRSGNYGLSGISLFKNKAEKFKLQKLKLSM